MKTYQGKRERSGGFVIQSSVTVDGEPLKPRLDLFNHSPTGFEWGYAGSGPAQLALAILADHLGPEREAEAVCLHQQFKGSIVAFLGDEWRITSEQIERVLAGFKNNLFPRESQ